MTRLIKIKNSLLIAFLLLLVSITAVASGGGELKHINVNVKDTAALQRGAVIFVNNCLSCHEAAYMRYNRLGKDLGLTDDQVRASLITGNNKIGETMTVSMSPDEARAWFGNIAPDLSVIGRSRGASWLYAYLTSFYEDDTGHWNNTVFPDVAMPHVLWDLQGIQKAVYHEEDDGHGGTHPVFSHFEITKPGAQSAEEYEGTVHDLVSYLIYMGEPAKIQRESMGIWVLLFIALFTFVAYLLKVEYWKDIH